MFTEELTADTQKILRDGETIRNFVNSDGWRMVRQKLFAMLIGLDSVTGISRENKTDAEILRELGIRQEAISLVMDWLRDIEGEASRAKSNAELFREQRENDYMRYYGDER